MVGAREALMFASVAAAGAATMGCDSSRAEGARASAAAISSFASESGTLQLSDDDARLFVLNKGVARGTLTVLQVKDPVTGQDARVKVGEALVGADPQSVSVDAAGARAYVSNGADSTVTVIDLLTFDVVRTIAVGSEPRGTALTPRGTRLYVAESADGTLVEIDTATGAVVGRAALAARGVERPWAVTVTNDGDADEEDERVVVTDFYARPRPGKTRDQVEMFDDGKEGRVAFVDVATRAVTGVAVLSPMASGFTADRRPFDPQNGAANDTFKSVAPVASTTPQGALFNQLGAVSVDPSTGRLYVNAIGASPEPPVKFNVNVQALVGVIDPATQTEVAAAHVNLNEQIKAETQPPEPFAGSLVRAFAADTVDMAIRNGVVVLVSRAGSFVMKGAFDATGRLTLNASAATPAVRVATGNIPTGVVLNGAGTRAYVNAEVDHTVTVIDLTTGAALGAAIESAPLPATGTSEHDALIGKLAFFTGMGLPAQGLAGQDVRSIDSTRFRGMASDNNWSSCASCHPAGLADGITWAFDNGPRQTLPLDASYSRKDPQQQRVFNWSAVRSSVTDFNNNARGVQGGKGFTADPATDAGRVFNHGPAFGVSDALDLMTLWVQVGIRTWNGPSTLDLAQVAAGRQAFTTLGCADCHGGDQWTSSRVRYALPLFRSDPAAPGGVAAIDSRVQQLANGAVLLAFNENFDATFDDDADGFADTPIVTRFSVNGLPASPTLDLTNRIEVRGAGGLIGKASVGAAGSFNPPSLLGLASSAPYGHHGRAETVEAVFRAIVDGGLGHPTFGATQQQLAELATFLRSIDGRTLPIQ